MGGFRWWRSPSALGQKDPLSSQPCDLWGLAGCQQWVFRSGHGSLGDEQEQSGLKAAAPPGERAGGQAGGISSVDES